MDLDIIRKIKLTHLKASFETLTLKHKFFLILFLFSLLSTLLPHVTFAIQNPNVNPGPALIFDMGNTDYQDFLDQVSQNLTDNYYQQKLEAQVLYEQRLTQKVAAYLKDQGSPLAEYASTLITLRNWKKIIALSNAESSMCRRYPEALANCWGVGGANLWDMGSNLGQGIVAMNHFLNKYPLRSPVKYSQMNFEEMNGLYKQPPAQHWVDNNTIVYDQLAAIENSIE